MKPGLPGFFRTNKTPHNPYQSFIATDVPNQNLPPPLFPHLTNTSITTLHSLASSLFSEVANAILERVVLVGFAVLKPTFN